MKELPEEIILTLMGLETKYDHIFNDCHLSYNRIFTRFGTIFLNAKIAVLVRMREGIRMPAFWTFKQSEDTSRFDLILLAADPGAVLAPFSQGI